MTRLVSSKRRCLAIVIRCSTPSLISSYLGPIAGGPFPESHVHPPAVTTEFFEQVCPHPTIVDVAQTQGDLQWASASNIMSGFSDALRKIDDNCIELKRDSGQVFNFWIFGDGSRMSDIWDELIHSPILTEWKWSPLALSAIETNRHLIHPSIDLNGHHRASLPGLLALHIRRNDFKDHCLHLAKWKSSYNAFNVRPDFPDQFVPPEGGGDGDNTSEGYAFYQKHCFPEIDDIVRRAMEVRAESKRPLDRIYILTNGRKEWLEELKASLREKTGPWTAITTSRDLKLTWEQKYVAQAMDMSIATRAEVFVGNAWSSLTSNVNLLRMAQSRSPYTTRFR
ncbi:hypothetical protein OF83DRAFT_1288934 [Amylostereum chailletii]|nr:hypothetical protein OF83DRAFT_1288934 [Amylostereum chailletii]